MARLAGSEIDSLLRFVYDATTVERDAAVTPEVLAGLRGLVPTADLVLYCDLDWNRQLTARLAGEDWELVDWDGDEVYWRLHEQHPVCACFDSTGDFRPRKVTDFLRSRDWRARELYNLLYRPFQYELDVRIPAQDGHTKTFIFRSSERDFTERDRLVLSLLHPHLQAIDETYERQRSLAVDVPLTRREREILGWVERGKTNPEIAQILWISPLTVRKHLENAYEKLGVQTRTAAIARLRTATSASTHR